MSCSTPQSSEQTAIPLEYPVTAKVSQTDNYFGTQVADPYRWLEVSDSAAVTAWVKDQNKATFGYLEKIPFRKTLLTRLSELYNYPKYSAPFKGGNRYFYFKNDGLQNQSVLYVQNSLTDSSKVLLDPNTLSKDGTVSLSSMAVSHDGKYFGYATSEGGSDWNNIFVIEVASGKLLDDRISWSKFSGISWYKDGFFYSRYDAPASGKALEAKNEFHKVYYHKIGTKQEQDQLVYEDVTKPLRNFYAQTSDDENLLILYFSEGAAGENAFSVKDLTKKEATWQPIITNFESQYSVIDYHQGKLLVLTNNGAPRYRLVAINPSKPQPSAWETLIPESENVLSSVQFIGGRLFAEYMKDAKNEVIVFDETGKKLHDVQLPGLGTVGGFAGKKEDKETFFSFTSFTQAPAIYRYDIEKNTSTLFRETKLAAFDAAAYETKQVFYASKDGTKIPMFLVYKKGLELNGQNPTYLYGYGGFNISLTPSFNPLLLPFIENGGVYAMANLRGGGEYGEAWHKAGMLDKKQNVFDDFIAAAEYLIKEKYTSSAKLAISGRSNGGLLVGAAMTQRPDLFKVALPGVGVMDMLRFHKFTIGWAWSPEYGASDSSEAQFKNLYAYSPLHNLKQGTAYPATLVTTADHDDRVVPAHSYKFIAALQEKHKGANPVLIRIDEQAGHGAGKPTSKILEEWADIWSFVLYNLGVNPDLKK